MEHIPAIHAAKVGMRYPARVTALFIGGVSLDLDLSAVAPGRNPSLGAVLYFKHTVSSEVARAIRFHDRFEVVLIANPLDTYDRRAALPADPAWLTWNGGTVRALAQRIRNTNDEALYPILADALEDAGCAEAELLARCRDPHGDSLTWLAVLLATQE